MKMPAIIKIICSAVSVMIVLSASFLWAHGDKPEKKIKPAIKSKSHWSSPGLEKKRINPVPDTIESIQRGKDLYADNCLDCHGSDADGNGPDAEYMEPRPSNLRAMAGHHSDGDMAWKIENGKGSMPAWKDELSELQVWDLVNFIQNLKKQNLKKSD